MFDALRRIHHGLRRSREAVFGRVSELFRRGVLDEAFWEELEELLIQADLGVSTTEELLAGVRSEARRQGADTPEQVRELLQAEMAGLLEGDSRLVLPASGLGVILVVGVNGTGKTTTIGKLAAYLQREGRTVVLAAADTFRAAAIEQLRIWGERAGVPTVAHQLGADPGAVVYDAVQAAISRSADALIVDTAGRLHTKFNLMEELRKIRRVLGRLDPTSPHEVLLVMDATTGQNGLSQARHFTEAVGVTGIVLAKLDGTAKGGMVFPIKRELGLPIKFVGVGEGLEDLAEFDAREFVQELFRPD